MARKLSPVELLRIRQALNRREFEQRKIQREKKAESQNPSATWIGKDANDGRPIVRLSTGKEVKGIGIITNGALVPGQPCNYRNGWVSGMPFRKRKEEVQTIKKEVTTPNIKFVYSLLSSDESSRLFYVGGQVETPGVVLSIPASATNIAAKINNTGTPEDAWIVSCAYLLEGVRYFVMIDGGGRSVEYIDPLSPPLLISQTPAVIGYGLFAGPRFYLYLSFDSDPYLLPLEPRGSIYSPEGFGQDWIIASVLPQEYFNGLSMDGNVWSRTIYGVSDREVSIGYYYKNNPIEAPATRKMFRAYKALDSLSQQPVIDSFDITDGNKYSIQDEYAWLESGFVYDYISDLIFCKHSLYLVYSFIQAKTIGDKTAQLEALAIQRDFKLSQFPPEEYPLESSRIIESYNLLLDCWEGSFVTLRTFDENFGLTQEKQVTPILPGLTPIIISGSNYMPNGYSFHDSSAYSI